MTSSLSRADFYFQCFVVVIAFVGMATNGVILYAMVAAKEHRKHTLIFNQNLLDFVYGTAMATTNSIKLAPIYLSGTSGHWLCLLLLNDSIAGAAYFGSLINLEAITVERYVKIVHAVWAKNKLHHWVIYVAVAFSWIGGCIISAALIHTSRVVDSYCYPMVFWKSQDARKALAIWYFMSFYVIILLLFIFCYGRILVVLRHQASVMGPANHGGTGSSNAHSQQSNKIQKSIDACQPAILRHLQHCV